MHPVRSSVRNSTVRRGRRHFIGLLDDEPVATGSGYVDEHHVHVEFISTLETCRGRGVGYAITAAATLAAADRPALLIASDLGQPVYRRLGYIAILAVHAVGRPSRRILRCPTCSSPTSARSSNPESRPSTAAGWWDDTTIAGLVTEYASSRPIASGVRRRPRRPDLAHARRVLGPHRGHARRTGAGPGTGPGVLLPDGASVHAVYLACEQQVSQSSASARAAGGARSDTSSNAPEHQCSSPRTNSGDEPPTALFAALAKEGTALGTTCRDPDLRTHARRTDHGRRPRERRQSDHRVDVVPSGQWSLTTCSS